MGITEEIFFFSSLFYLSCRFLGFFFVREEFIKIDKFFYKSVEAM